MKKAIGLTADISTFNTTLPQTRHLNYFMNTNPQRFANGGDVKAGIPNYPNPNVTSGFLPMALGFDNGGDAGEKKTILGAIISIIAKQFNKLESNPDVIETATDIVNNQPALAEKLLQQARQTDVETEVKLQEDALNVPTKPVTPIETVTVTPEPITTRSDRQGSFDNVPLKPLPKISKEQKQREFEDSQKPMGPIPKITPPDDGGITSITPDAKPLPKISTEQQQREYEDSQKPTEFKDPMDLNGDGVVNYQDYLIAIRNGMLDIAKAILDKLGLYDEETPEKIEPEKIEPEKIEPEKIEPEKIEPEKIEPKLKPEPDGGGITELPKVSEEQIKRDTEDKQVGISSKDQKLFKLLAKERAKEDGTPDSGGITDKKDVPAWALPMMSAGFSMMASKSPYFMQALGEAGQAGVETYTAQKTAEEDKLDKESQRDLETAQAAYYRGEGRQAGAGSPIVIGGKYYYKDGKPYMIVKNGVEVHASATMSREDAITLLTKNNPMFPQLPVEEQQKQIKAIMDLYNLGDQKITSNVPQDTENESGGILSDIYDYGKDKLGLKDGGIVSIRR